MSTRKKLRLLCAKGDHEALQPVLDALGKKGVRIAEGGEGMTLCALSEAFYADEGCTNALFALLSRGGDKVLPLQLDGAPIPERIKNALYARNIIPAEGRGSEQLAERIAAAIPDKPNRLPWVFGLAGAVLLAVIGIFVWRSAGTGEEALPAMAQTDYDFAIPEGLSAEELFQVRCVVIVGDHFRYYTQEERLPRYDGGDGWRDMIYELASEEPHATSVDWYWHEDGSLITESDYDLRFLSLMPNLEELHILLANITQTPDLRALDKLRVVWLQNTRMPDLTWLADSHVQKLNVECMGVDFSPLGKSETLQFASFDLHNAVSADFSTFSPPHLRELEVNFLFSEDGFAGANFDGLAACSELQKLGIFGGPVSDLSFLAGTPELVFLELDGLYQLRDISVLGTLKSLSMLAIRYCPLITDYTPIAGCDSLYAVEFHCDDDPYALQDVSFLRDLPELIDVGLYGCHLRNLDFLEGLADNGAPLRLAFAGDIQDYSGLACVKEYEYLHVNPRYNNGNRGGDFAAVQPYIQGAKIQRLSLFRCRGVELSALPDGVERLWINGGDLEDLQGLKPYALRELELRDCQYLRSLEGLENISTLSMRGEMVLSVLGCPRLTDWSALSGARLDILRLVGVYAIPELREVRFQSLRLESIEGLTDLRFLVGLNGGEPFDLRLTGLTELRDLSPLAKLSGAELAVPPQVSGQAADLVAAGNYQYYLVEYPNSDWQPQDSAVELLSLEELETLPAALLRRVESVTLAGDTVVDTGRYEICDDWEHRDEEGRPGLVLRDRDSGEETPVEPGSLTDLDAFSALTGLRSLTVCAQPIESLDGLQELSELEWLRVVGCQELTDASAAFACQQLRSLKLDYSAVESVQGIQNLEKLQELSLCATQVHDLSPLGELDCGVAMAERGGFWLNLSNTPLEDCSGLAAIPVLENLDINGVDAALWVPWVVNTEIRRLAAYSFTRDSAAPDVNALFAEFIHAHPGLTELCLQNNDGITDLTPVLELRDLRALYVTQNMPEAVESLEGQSLGFELEVQ